MGESSKTLVLLKLEVVREEWSAEAQGAWSVVVQGAWSAAVQGARRVVAPGVLVAAREAMLAGHYGLGEEEWGVSLGVRGGAVPI